jgi:hypothetical protein
MKLKKISSIAINLCEPMFDTAEKHTAMEGIEQNECTVLHCYGK